MKDRGTVIIGLIAIILILGSAPYAPSPPTIVSDLTGTTWKLFSATIDPPLDTGGETTITDLMLLLDTCELDDSVVFNVDSIVIYHQGTNECDTVIGPYYEMWFLDSTQTDMIFYDEYYFTIDTVDIEFVSSDTFKFSYFEHRDTIYTVSKIYTKY